MINGQQWKIKEFKRQKWHLMTIYIDNLYEMH